VNTSPTESALCKRLGAKPVGLAVIPDLIKSGTKASLTSCFAELITKLLARYTLELLFFIKLVCLEAVIMAQLRDVDEVYKRFQAARVEVLSSLDPASARLALQRLLPYPVRCLHPMIPQALILTVSHAKHSVFCGFCHLRTMGTAPILRYAWATTALTGVCDPRTALRVPGFSMTLWERYAALALPPQPTSPEHRHCLHAHAQQRQTVTFLSLLARLPLQH